ncbi:MAG TPA: hypothetical protein VIJ00_06050 [Nakamurella sp.]
MGDTRQWLWCRWRRRTKPATDKVPGNTAGPILTGYPSLYQE